MYERFTDRARKVMRLANQEARRLNHDYIGTEHILLGLAKEGTGVGANVLKKLNIDVSKIIGELEQIFQTGPEMVKIGELPLTPRAKKVIEYAAEEASNLNHKYVGTEHLLLGLFREHEGVAAQVLINREIKLEDVRKEVLNSLGSVKEVNEVAANVLKNPDIDLGKIHLEMEKIVHAGLDIVTMGKLPQTPSAMRAIEYAIEEARNLNHDYVGKEHLLLGLLRDETGVAAQVLINLGIKLEDVRIEIRKLLGSNDTS